MVGDIKTTLLLNGVKGLRRGGEYDRGIGFNGFIGPYSA